MVITYISWDPGERTTGRTLWDECADPVLMEDLVQCQFDTELEKTPETVKYFIIEQYRPYGHVNHTGDRLLTAQRIGDIKGYARRHSIEVIEVPANVKQVAAKWSRMKIPPKSTHMPDWMASFLIGYWWLRTQGYIKSKLLKDN